MTSRVTSQVSRPPADCVPVPDLPGEQLPEAGSERAQAVLPGPADPTPLRPVPAVSAGAWRALMTSSSGAL